MVVKKISSATNEAFFSLSQFQRSSFVVNHFVSNTQNLDIEGVSNIMKKKTPNWCVFLEFYLEAEAVEQQRGVEVVEKNGNIP